MTEMIHILCVDGSLKLPNDDFADLFEMARLAFVMRHNTNGQMIIDLQMIPHVCIAGVQGMFAFARSILHSGIFPSSTHYLSSILGFDHPYMDETIRAMYPHADHIVASYACARNVRYLMYYFGRHSSAPSIRTDIDTFKIMIETQHTEMIEFILMHSHHTRGQRVMRELLMTNSVEAIRVLREHDYPWLPEEYEPYISRGIYEYYFDNGGRITEELIESACLEDDGDLLRIMLARDPTKVQHAIIFACVGGESIKGFLLSELTSRRGPIYECAKRDRTRIPARYLEHYGIAADKRKFIIGSHCTIQ